MFSKLINEQKKIQFDFNQFRFVFNSKIVAITQIFTELNWFFLAKIK